MSADGWFCGCGHRLPVPTSNLALMRCSVCKWTCDGAGRVTPLPPLPQAPEPVAAPVEGYRVWRVHRDDHVTLTRQLVQQLFADHEAGRNPFRALLPGARLHPVASGTGAWESVHTAVCTQHEAPQRGCSCGLWALKDEAEAHRVAADYQLTSGYAVGKLRLWGRVVEHTRGYRGQHAQPVSLTYVGDGPEAGEVAGELSAFYGCPCAVQAPAVPDPFPPGFHPTVQLGNYGLGSSALAAQLAVNSGGHLVTTNVAASNAAAALSYIAGVAPYDQGGRRAWPVRFARWTRSDHTAGLTAYMVLCSAPIGFLPAGLGPGPLWIAPVALLSPAWIIFWKWANK